MLQRDVASNFQNADRLCRGVQVYCGVLQRVAVCCVAIWLRSFRMQNVCAEYSCGAVCCSVLQCVAVCCSAMYLCSSRMQNVYIEEYPCIAVCCSVQHYIAVLLQCVAVCCSVLQCDKPSPFQNAECLYRETACTTILNIVKTKKTCTGSNQNTCAALQHTATHCNTLQHTATHEYTCAAYTISLDMFFCFLGQI